MGCPQSRESASNDDGLLYSNGAAPSSALDLCRRAILAENKACLDPIGASKEGGKYTKGQAIRTLPYGRSDDDTSAPAFSIEQRRLIKESWSHLSPNLSTVGKQLFLRIFEFRPSVKQMFPFREAWGDQLIRHPLFIEQARRFMSVIAAVVGVVDELSSARCGSPALVDLGRRHVTIEGFLPDYFDVFTRAVTGVWQQELRDVCTTDVIEAWKALFIYIIQQIKVGYDDEMRARNMI